MFLIILLVDWEFYSFIVQWDTEILTGSKMASLLNIWLLVLLLWEVSWRFCAGTSFVFHIGFSLSLLGLPHRIMARYQQGIFQWLVAKVLQLLRPRPQSYTVSLLLLSIFQEFARWHHSRESKIDSPLLWLWINTIY